ISLLKDVIKCMGLKSTNHAKRLKELKDALGECLDGCRDDPNYLMPPLDGNKRGGSWGHVKQRTKDGKDVHPDGTDDLDGSEVQQTCSVGATCAK
ncbi:MAG: hypothetical protein KAI66_27540, partial [Lentisphaeria bacterium]|nr:hypothetical protein [Lentisphaeria bacterium]